MIDAGADLAAILDDCGGSAMTANGPLGGRLVTEPIELDIDGRLIHSSETVFYAAAEAIESVRLVKNAWIEPGGVRYFAKDIPRPDSTGLVRIVLKA